MHIHDDITRITEADSINRFGLQDFALADFPAVTREMGLIPVETSVGEDLGSRLPSTDRALNMDQKIYLKLLEDEKRVLQKLLASSSPKERKDLEGAIWATQTAIKDLRAKWEAGSR